MRAEKSGAAGYQCTHSCSPGITGSAPVLAHQRKHGVDYVVDVVVGHRGIDGQRQAAAENVLGDRKIAIAIAVAALIVMDGVKRNAVDRASDAALAQHLDELVAADGQALGAEPEYIEMPGVLDTRFGVRGLNAFVGAKG